MSLNLYPDTIDTNDTNLVRETIVDEDVPNIGPIRFIDCALLLERNKNDDRIVKRRMLIFQYENFTPCAFFQSTGTSNIQSKSFSGTYFPFYGENKNGLIKSSEFFSFSLKPWQRIFKQKGLSIQFLKYFTYFYEFKISALIGSYYWNEIVSPGTKQFILSHQWTVTKEESKELDEFGEEAVVDEIGEFVVSDPLPITSTNIFETMFSKRCSTELTMETEQINDFLSGNGVRLNNSIKRGGKRRNKSKSINKNRKRRITIKRRGGIKRKRSTKRK